LWHFQCSVCCLIISSLNTLFPEEKLTLICPNVLNSKFYYHQCKNKPPITHWYESNPHPPTSQKKKIFTECVTGCRMYRNFHHNIPCYFSYWNVHRHNATKTNFMWRMATSCQTKFQTTNIITMSFLSEIHTVSTQQW
jgi:hypothetical protein